eukprot:m.355764 g.355764  ORF g.355764 m.355764 type:complete len:870 (+) comp17333_c0_seq1:119-2728(+)
MGSGASTSSGGRRSSKATNSSEFEEFCLLAFRSADKDNNGVLDTGEFWDVLTSKTLNLNLSEDEIKSIQAQADVDDDGEISYEEFIPVFKQILNTIYQDKDEDWNDWCRIHNEQGEAVYLNKRTGVTQYEKPANYNEERVEIQSFDYLTLPDGTVLTTYYDDQNSQLLYMDWDTQTWQVVPDQWLKQAHGDESSTDQLEDDPRTGEFTHPVHGTFVTYLFENTRNYRLYYNESGGRWERMPLEWEMDVPEVSELLKELDSAFPQWQNVSEQLLVLRECDYNLTEAMMFAQTNFASKWSDKAAGGSGASSATSLATAKRIAELEKQVAERDAQLAVLREEQSEKATVAQRELVREKTRVEAATMRKAEAAQEAEERIETLLATNSQLRDDIASLESKLVAAQSDAERAAQLEAQLKAGTTVSNGSQQAMKELTGKLEEMRMQNVALKLKAQSLKAQLSKTANLKEKYGDMQVVLRNLRKQKEAVHTELQECVAFLTPKLEEASAAARKIKENNADLLAEITKKYLHEQTQRKLLYNKVQELRGNIRVFCRVRRDDRSPCVFQFPSDTETLLPKLQGGTEMFEFEHVYGPNSKQETVFGDTKPIILSCVDGYNVCIMAYGQTGSGKTYTMMGPKDNPGVNRRAIKELLALCDSREEVEYDIKVSLMEVYNEKIFDLLTADRSKDLKIHASPEGTYVGGLIEEQVKTQDDVLRVMETGDQNRTVGATKMNTDSSRSHLLLQLTVNGYNTISKASTSGKLTLVDLAGSERVSKTDASGDRLVEAAAINKSLTCLGQVFKALATNSPHVPYRNSKLTHALQDSLGGDSKTAIFVNVSPLESNLSETHMTLKFGQNIRKIELGPATKKKGPPKRR